MHKLEKEVQNLIENNLETVFNCKFIATEFSTGHEHAGRIDSLGLSEDNNPVILEYKKIEIPSIARDVTDVGHYGTGDFELTITNDEELEVAKEYIFKSYENIGG